MELWIRSQDRKTLAKCENLYIQEYTDRVALCYGLITYGTYKSVDRAKEILDDIQTKMKNKYLAKVNPIVNQKDFYKIIKAYEEFNGIDLIASNELVDITPINQEVLVYEIPKE